MERTTSSLAPAPPHWRASAIRLGDVAYASVCLLAFSLPTDYIVAFAYATEPGARMPSVYLGVLAAALCAPLLVQQLRPSRRFAPVLLIAGSMMVGVLSLAVLVALGDAGWNREAERPLKLGLMGILFVLAASESRWRGPLVFSYMAGWGIFVVYALHAVVSGQAEVMEHYEVVRASLAGLNQNEQSVLVASGMVVLLAEMVNGGISLRTVAYLAALLASGAAFVVGVSRSATLALAAGCALVAFAALRGPGRLTWRAAKLATMLALLVAGGAVLVGRNEIIGEAAQGLGQRFEYAVRGDDTGSRGRLASKALDLAVRNPWHGVGIGRARVYVGDDPHNSYARIVAEGGVLAAALLAAGLALIAAAVFRAAVPGASLGPVAALAVLMVWAAAGQALVGVPFWFFLAVVSADAARLRAP